MAWMYLLLAGTFEIAWPVGLKLAQTADNRIGGILLSVFFMMCSGFFLFLAQKTIPMGIAYAIWASIGIVGTFIVSVMFFQQSLNYMNSFGITMIILGVASLKGS